MKNYLKLTSLIFMFLVMGCKSDQEKNVENTQVTIVSSEEAEKLMQLESTQLVDVRTEEELESGKIEGALNMVYQKNFAEKIASLDKTKPVLVYCQSGRRSAKCVEILKEAGFEKIYDLEGGVTQWLKDGKTLVK